MDFPSLQLTLSSAEDLKDVKTFGRMHPYAVAWIDPHRTARTAAHRDGGTHPSWNQTLELSVANRQLLESGKSKLVVRILCHGLFREKLVGTVTVPFKVIRDRLKASLDDSLQPFSYLVKRPSGRFQGILDFSVRFLYQHHEQISSLSPSASPLPDTSRIADASLLHPQRDSNPFYPPVSAGFESKNQANDNSIYSQVQMYPPQSTGIRQGYSWSPTDAIYIPYNVSM